MTNKIVLHVITSLAVGGAERSLCNIILSTKTDFNHYVVSLAGDGIYADKLKQQSVPVYCFKSDSLSTLLLPYPLSVISKLFFSSKPDVIDCWMPHSCLVGALLKIVHPRAKLIWNIRQNPSNSSLKPTTRLVYLVLSLLSRLPSRIVFNSSEALLKYHFLPKTLKNISIIRNGFHESISFLTNFPSVDKDTLISALPPDAFLCVNVARYHPVKNHDLCLKSFIVIAKTNCNVFFALAGRGVQESCFPFLVAQPVYIRKRFIFLGELGDLNQLYSRANLYVSCSNSEGFPNSIAEAMLHNTPCVASDVGETSFIIGDTGIVLKSPTIGSVVAAITSFLNMSYNDRVDFGHKSRQRILDNFPLSSTISRYCDLYESP